MFVEAALKVNRIVYIFKGAKKNTKRLFLPIILIKGDINYNKDPACLFLCRLSQAVCIYHLPFCESLVYNSNTSF